MCLLFRLKFFFLVRLLVLGVCRRCIFATHGQSSRLNIYSVILNRNKNEPKGKKNNENATIEYKIFNAYGYYLCLFGKSIEMFPMFKENLYHLVFCFFYSTLLFMLNSCVFIGIYFNLIPELCG